MKVRVDWNENEATVYCATLKQNEHSCVSYPALIKSSGEVIIRTEYAVYKFSQDRTIVFKSDGITRKPVRVKSWEIIK